MVMYVLKDTIDKNYYNGRTISMGGAVYPAVVKDVCEAKFYSCYKRAKTSLKALNKKSPWSQMRFIVKDIDLEAKERYTINDR